MERRVVSLRSSTKEFSIPALCEVGRVHTLRTLTLRECACGSFDRFVTSPLSICGQTLNRIPELATTTTPFLLLFYYYYYYYYHYFFLFIGATNYAWAMSLTQKL